MAKQIIYGDDVRKAIKLGVDKLANAVKATLGPRGRYVLLEKNLVHLLLQMMVLLLLKR